MTRQERTGLPVRSFVVPAIASAIAGVATLRMAVTIDSATAADADVFLWAVELAGALTAATFGALLLRRSGTRASGWLLQLAAVGLALSALTDSGAVTATAWQPFGDSTATLQLWANLLGRVLLLAAGVVSLPDRVVPGRVGGGAPTAVVASLAVGVTAGLLLNTRPETLRATSVGFGNRAWVDAAAEVPAWVFAVILAVHAVLLISLSRRRGGEPTAFQVVGWGLAAAALPSAVPAIADRLPIVINDVLVAVTWPVLPVVSVIAALRAVAWRTIAGHQAPSGVPHGLAGRSRCQTAGGRGFSQAMRMSSTSIGPVRISMVPFTCMGSSPTSAYPQARYRA